MTEEDPKVFEQTAIIDCGSYSIKTGISSDVLPRSVYPTAIGYFKRTMIDCSSSIYHIGSEAASKPSIFNVRHPIEEGIITNWDDMEKIIRHTFYNELRIDPAKHAVLISESAFNTKPNREKMIQIIFETFNAPAFCLVPQTNLSLYLSGKTTGLVSSFGYNASYFVPIYEGYSISHAKMMQKLGGFDIYQHLIKLLSEEGHSFTTYSEKEAVREMMEKHCYVALDYYLESTSHYLESTSYILPDETAIDLNKERFQSTEILFKPHLVEKDYDEIDKIIFDSIKKCDIDMRNDLYSNICLSGGPSMFEGLPERIEKEITDLAPPTMKVKVTAHPERKYGSYLGASILCSLDTFPQMAISQSEYNDAGTRIVNVKCIF